MAPVLAEQLGSQRPTIEDLTGDNHYAQVARKYWLGKSKVKKVQSNVIKQDLWDHIEKNGFSHSDLLLLEQLQVLDRYLWPGYTEDASDQHVMLLALVVQVKRQEGVPSWDAFSSDSGLFASFFHRVTQLAIDEAVAFPIRTYLIQFVISAYQSLDVGIIRKECASLVSIGIWHNLHSDEVRQTLLGKTVQLGKAWRAVAKRYDGSDNETQARLRSERTWIYSLALDLFNSLYNVDNSRDRATVAYCTRVIELLSDLLSQMPTRRYVHTLLRDLNIIPVIVLSPAYVEEDNILLREMVVLLKHFMDFPIDDFSGKEPSTSSAHDIHVAKLVELQQIAMRDFKEKLTILALSNFGSLDNRADLGSHLESLTDDEMKRLCEALEYRVSYPTDSAVVQDRHLYQEMIIFRNERVQPYKTTVRDMTVLPTEDAIYETAIDRTENYDGTQPLAMPKLNLQYLTVSDFLWRSFLLYRSESFYEIRKHLEDAVKRVQPRRTTNGVHFDGFSRLAIPITKPAIIDTGPPFIGEEHPSQVLAEVTLDMGRFAPGVRREWESTRQGDVVYLVAVNPSENSRALTNGGSHDAATRPVKRLRCAEVFQVLDDNGKPLRIRDEGHTNGYSQGGRRRKFLLNLDPRTYAADKKASDLNKGDVYESINLLVRRRGRENNFKPVLESIKHLVLTDTPAPAWLQEVFLGYSDPSAATYKHMPNRLRSIDFRDTFLDWAHLVESLPGKTVEPAEEADGSFPPPYVLETSTAEVVNSRPTKKRRRDRDDVQHTSIVENVKISTYQPTNNGPYPSDKPRVNTVRFTPTQVEAITSGTQPGLTVIVGPPGTGKTDVATQIVSNLYHNFPMEKTLLVAHSNQALNQLFQKITALDIDERHLLRLGHGEEELETELDYSKHGRIDSLMERSAQYLREVNRLAASIGAPGAHGNSCETAEYFDKVYIKPAWMKFWDIAKSANDGAAIIAAFPFHTFFANSPKPVFPPDATKEQVMYAAEGCHNHMKHLFETLSATRPFELLRAERDKANYLLQTSARIVAMTSTHAAMRRSEIAALGFHYSNIIIEESAQITEIETFIPLALQRPVDGDMPLKRIVLVGDHLQNAPVIQNEAFRSHANLEQSLFRRLIRLGVPHITLDAQGRARPSIARLYAWRYPTLTDLPLVTAQPEFLSANAGFAHPYQFVDVGLYKGRGEQTPSPHFVQNLGEAEYAVALFQYMRLLGYPASKISILTMYAGQKALIRDVLGHRCKGNRLFGMPRAVSTVDRYQGEQNDYVILSLVRTERVGYLRDLRRMTVALSRARLGLYVLGRRELFESVLELRPVFERLFEKGQGKLELVTGEMFPATRGAEDAVEEGKSVHMDGVEHLGQYVFEMTRAKVEDLKKGVAEIPAEEMVRVGESSDDGEGEVEQEESEQEIDEP